MIRDLVDWLNNTFFVFWWIVAFGAVVATLTGWPVRRPRRAPTAARHGDGWAGVVACQQVGDDLVVWSSEQALLPEPFRRLRDEAPLWAASGMVQSEAALRVPVHFATDERDVVVDLAEVGTLSVSPACESMLTVLGDQLVSAGGVEVIEVLTADEVPSADARLWARREHARATGVDWAPIVTVLDFTGLVGPVPAGEGVALVRVASPDGGWSVVPAGEDTAVLEPTGITVRVPLGAAADEARDERRKEASGEVRGTWPTPASAAEVDVLVLGDVNVRGGRRPLESARAVAVSAQLLELTDALSTAVLQPAGAPAISFLSGFGKSAAGATNGFAAVAVGIVAVVAGLALWVELLVRSALVYLLVALSPLAFAAAVWPAARGTARRLVELLLAVIVSKLAIAIALAVGVAALGGAGRLRLRRRAGRVPPRGDDPVPHGNRRLPAGIRA